MQNITFGRPRGKAAAASELSCPCCYRPGVALCEQFSPADNALKLKGMRSLLSAHGLGGYLVPSGDAHSSEYVAREDQRREWLTGFTGSAGTALVTPTHALLWTDGR
jgi:Xaa-Pro aminopeptidase